MRETDGACQTLVCGFIQIYDGRVQWRGGGREGEAGSQGGGKTVGEQRANFYCSFLKSSGKGVPEQQSS